MFTARRRVRPGRLGVPAVPGTRVIGQGLFRPGMDFLALVARPIRNIVRGPGSALPQWLVATGSCRVVRGLMLDLRIELGAVEKDETGQVKPGDEHDHSA